MRPPLPVEYRVSLRSRAAHLYEIEARFGLDAPAPTLDLLLPVWTPGSYLVREYPRHLQDLACSDENDRPLAVHKIDKATFRVAAEGAAIVVARYRVYAHEVTVRTSHLDETHAYWNGACLFLYTPSLRRRPARVVVSDLPAGWNITSGLDPAGDDPAGFVAADYDALVDSPFEIGPHQRTTFHAAGKPHDLVAWGRLADGARAQLVADLGHIIELQARLFDGLPYDRYAFLIHLVPNGYGGLEHRNSTTVLTSPHAFGARKKYEELLELLSHEFFHLWNVKRIFPTALGDLDYQREAYTRSLWVCEGWTSYYDRLLVRRAGLMTPGRYLERLGEELTRLLATPGRSRHSLETASFDAWIKHYRPDENTVNSTVSYYLKGSLVALLLDLEIRRRTEGRRSLDDALRLLWQRYGLTARAYADEAIQPAVEEAVGIGLDDFFAGAVRGTAELEVTGPLAAVGLTLRAARPEREDDRGGWLGATVVQEGDRLRVSETLEGSPAQRGGLCPGDQLLAFDGFRVDKERLQERLAERRADDRVRLAVFRRDELQQIELTLAERPSTQRKLEVVIDEEAPAAARALREGWLG